MPSGPAAAHAKAMFAACCSRQNEEVWARLPWRLPGAKWCQLTANLPRPGDAGLDVGLDAELVDFADWIDWMTRDPFQATRQQGRVYERTRPGANPVVLKN